MRSGVSASSKAWCPANGWRIPDILPRSLGRKFLLAFGVTACGILLLANWLNYFASRAALENQLDESVIDALQHTGRELDLFVQKCGARCEPIIAREMANPHTPDQMRKFLVDLLARTPRDEAFDFYITYEDMDYRNPDSDLVVDRLSWPATYHSKYDYHEPRQEWYHQPKMKRQPHVTEPYYDLGSVNQSMVSYTLPLLDASNRFRGVVGVDILLDAITNIVAHLDIIPGQNIAAEQAFVVSKAGALISHPNAALLPSKSFAGAGLEAVPEGKYVAGAPQGFVSARLQGEVRRIYWATAPFTGWKVVADVSDDALRGPIKALTRQMAISTALTLAAMIVVIYLLSWRFSKPIQELADSANLLVSQVMPADSGKHPADEIGQIGQSMRRLAAYQSELDLVNRELESFTYSVSHDLRAPLRAISNYAGILNEDYGAKLDAEGRKICADIQSGVRNMNQLIEDLLRFSRLNRVPLNQGPVNMRELAAAAFAAVAAATPSQRAQFNLGPLPDAVGDAALLRQVWINLLSNAVKFSSRRPAPSITVSGAETDRELVFAVEDNGLGFDPQYASKLFGVFQRLHSVSEFEGTGVGLAIVQRIVHRHGGRVWAESRPGSGATFHFSLPKPAPIVTSGAVHP